MVLKMSSGERKDLSELISRLVEETITSDEVQRLLLKKESQNMKDDKYNFKVGFYEYV